MKHMLITTTLLSGSLLLLSACSSGGSSSSSSSSVPSVPAVPNRGTAFYVDSAVEGVHVLCGSTASVTDVNGAFTYEEGQNCQFMIGDIVVHRDANLYDGKVIIEDNLRTAQFLQSMDYDGNANNGIQIHNQTGDVLAQHNIHNVPSDDDILAGVVEGMHNSDIGYHGNFVHQADAQEHLNQTHQEHNQNTQQDNTTQHNQNDTYYDDNPTHNTQQDNTTQHNQNDTYYDDNPTHNTQQDNTQEHNSNDNDKNHR